MTILLSADCLYPAQLGGPSQAIYWQAKALMKAGHTVTIVATSHGLPPAIPCDQWLTTDYGQVIYTQNPHFYWPLKHIWYGWQALQNADVVHVNSLFYPASLVWVILCRLAGKPVVWSPHGELSPAALGFRRLLKQCLLRVMRCLTSSVVFHATSVCEAGFIRQHFGNGVKVVVIPNRMELPEQTITRPAEPPYLLFIGRLHPIKAIDRLIAALSQSRVFRESEYVLLIAGPVVDKAYEQRLKVLIEQEKLSTKVRFIEAVHELRKQTLYANARLTVLPSHAENFGNVVIESLVQGTPVVASIHTPWQWLADEHVGSWIANEPDSLRQAIDRYLMMSPEEYSGYRKRAATIARQQFDVMEKVTEWECFYEQLLLAARQKQQLIRTLQLDERR